MRYNTTRKADCFNKKPGVSSVTSKHNRKKTVKLTINQVKLLHSEVETFHPELAQTGQSFLKSFYPEGGVIVGIFEKILLCGRGLRYSSPPRGI